MIEHNAAVDFEKAQAGTLPAEMGIVWSEVTNGRAAGSFVVEQRHMAPNGFLHAASVIGLVDSAAGYGCVASLPEGASGFTTIELKSNFLASARKGETVTCEARLVHGGRTTQVWDAEAQNAATGKTMALFRCTQMILYPR
jgi:uncharacterized protein (TIGR00369 family)